MKTSIATVSVAGNLRQKLEAIAAAEFDGVEIFEQDFITSDARPRELGRMVRDHGLEIMLFQPFRDFEGLPEPLRTRAFARAERKFELMRELDTRDILICSSVHPDASGDVDRMAEDFAQLGEIAASYDIRVGFEALAWGKHVSDHRDAWEVVRRADHPNIGLVLDSFHTLSRKIDPDTIRAIPGDRIFFVQLADAPLINMDLLYWSRHFRNMPGEGDLDVLKFMRAVAATGYSGPISLEVFNDQFRGGPARTIARDGRRSLLALLDDVQRLEPGIKLEARPMPPRAEIEKIEFIEFAAQGDDKITLENFLTSLGFRISARHRNKSVTLWTQGGIRIVVNAEPEGFAASAWTVHGTTICDIGLRVSDARTTLERARMLGITHFSQRVGAGELEIPAIQGLGGSIMHFVDEASGLARVWEIEFEEQTLAARADCGLINIDHLAQTMSYDEMLSWSLFYTTLFDMKKSPTVQVIDPHGQVRSQAIASSNGAFRITLNGADTHRTLAGQFLADSFGSPVQHIAFGCADIFETAAKLRRLGLAILPIPSNYYDDLAARFAIPADTLEQLREGSILYDEDENGTFFHMYSQPFAGGMFVEILQRLGDYAGYGAYNAPFRIAAQKRLARQQGVPRS